MTRIPAFLVPIAAFAACSSGGDDRSQAAPVTPNVAITADNAAAVAGAAYETAYMPARLARIVMGFVEIAPPEPANGAHPAIVTQTLAGPEGGEATVTWSDADRDGLYTSGDAFTVTFDAYVANGLTLAGTATLEGLYVDGNPLTSLTWLCDATMTLLDVAFDDGSGARTASGSYGVHREERTTVQVLSLVAMDDAAVGLRTLGAGSGSGRNEYTLDFQQGFYGDGDFLDPVVGGTFVYETTRTMTGLQFLPDPGAGELRVIGANGTSVAIVPVDLFNVELLIDENGDGEADVTIATEWAAL